MVEPTAAQPFTTTVHHDLRMRRLAVLDVANPTPRLVRVTLGGTDMDGFRSLGAADHVKVFFPEPGAVEPTLPELGPDGLRLTPGAPRPRGRDYTPKHQRLAEQRLELDIVVHDEGIGSDWARRARVGDVLGVAGPRGSHVLAHDIEGFVFFGDETALPAITNFVAGARSDQHVVAHVEIGHEDDIQDLGLGDGHVHWHVRDGAGPGHSEVLVDAARRSVLPPGRVWHWVAAEADIARAVRAVLVDRGVDPDSIESRGYWKLDTRDHQEPHED